MYFEKILEKNLLECPKYSEQVTNNATIWLKYWTFCPEFPEFSENSIEFADIWLEFPKFSG